MNNFFGAFGNNFGANSNNQPQVQQKGAPTQFFQPQQFAQFLQHADPFASGKKSKQ